MDITLWVIQLALGILFILFGLMKVFNYEKIKAKQDWVENSPKTLTIFIGYSELLGGLGLILPNLLAVLTWLTPLSALGLSIIMVLAAVLHLRRKEYKAISINVLFLLLLSVVAIPY
ncbi:DoxX family protein [Priestia sp. GS2]|uniref:DoxX family protein n=1 Tax=Priestia sp. GS2 TaxID=3117403 RepID=UPI002EDBA91C